MYPVRVRTWSKVQHSHENFVMRVMLLQPKTFPQNPKVAGTMNRKEEGVGKVDWLFKECRNEDSSHFIHTCEMTAVEEF